MNPAANHLQEMYRQRVLEHSKHPHNARRPQQCTHEAVGFNPLCGDKLTVYLQMDGEHISDVAFEGTGCAISVASASMMTDAIRDRSAAEAGELITAAREVFTSGDSSGNKALEETDALAGVSNYPSRIKCAALAWSTAEAALAGKTKQVTTET
jgi:nitrogen fixation NifU-like protein